MRHLLLSASFCNLEPSGAAVQAWVCTLQHGCVIPVLVKHKKHGMAGEVLQLGAGEPGGWPRRWSEALSCLYVLGE